MILSLICNPFLMNDFFLSLYRSVLRVSTCSLRCVSTLICWKKTTLAWYIKTAMNRRYVHLYCAGQITLLNLHIRMFVEWEMSSCLDSLVHSLFAHFSVGWIPPRKLRDRYEVSLLTCSLRNVLFSVYPPSHYHCLIYTSSTAKGVSYNIQYIE